MASAFYMQIPSPELLTRLSTILADKSHSVGQCIAWTGPTDRYGYGIYRLTWGSKRIKLHVHRLSFYLSSQDFSPLDPSIHVSHTCHNKLCIRPTHLSYEPASVNNARKKCLFDGECTGHRGFGRCQLHSVTMQLVAFTLFAFCLFCVVLFMHAFQVFIAKVHNYGQQHCLNRHFLSCTAIR